MKLNIDGLRKGRDIGYSDSHPDSNRFLEICCCSARHCHLPGDTPKERNYYASLMIAAPEMFELLYKTRNHIDKSCRECESKAIVPEIDALLDKIEGGGE